MSHWRPKKVEAVGQKTLSHLQDRRTEDPKGLKDGRFIFIKAWKGKENVGEYSCEKIEVETESQPNLAIRHLRLCNKWTEKRY